MFCRKMDTANLRRSQSSFDSAVTFYWVFLYFNKYDMIDEQIYRNAWKQFNWFVPGYTCNKLVFLKNLQRENNYEVLEVGYSV